MSQEIGINPLIELKPIIKSFSENGWSNPKKILDRIILNIEESKSGNFTVESILNRVIDYLKEEKIITNSKSQADSIWNMLLWYFNEKTDYLLNDIVIDFQEACNLVSECLVKEAKFENVISNISKIIKNQNITYEEGFDKICLIVDRDKNSFFCKPDNDQYNYTLEKCEEKNYGFYLTNPCFEFWLLLHFKEVLDLDKNKLLQNSKVSNKYRYVEKELNQLENNFKKSKYDAHKFVKKVDIAIENEKHFCEDIRSLEYSLGSNLGNLFKELRQKS